MANNIRELRVAFLLSPRELAERIGTYPQQVYRLEASLNTPEPEWVEAIAQALGVPEDAVVTPDFDLSRFAAPTPVGARCVPPPRHTCPVGARFAIQSMIARLAGLKLALSISEHDLATAVRNLIAYVDVDVDSDKYIIRLSQSLQIVVLAILQGHGIVLDQRFVHAIEKAALGSASLIQSFSEIGESGCELVV